MKKLFLKSLALVMMLTMSVSMWADTEKFVAANASLYKTHYAPGWAAIEDNEFPTGNTSSTGYASYAPESGVFTITIPTACNGQWQAQAWLATGITFAADKSYDISFDINTTNGVGGITFKMGDAGNIVTEQIVTGANTHDHMSFANNPGKAACDGKFLLDFGFAPANTTITISNISIVEKEAAAPEPKESQCSGDLGHFAIPTNTKMHYEIEYDEGNVKVTATGIHNALDFAEIHVAEVGNYAMTSDGNGVYTWQHAGTLGADWYFRFLYSDISFPGNEMSSLDVNASDPNICYYKVGDCVATPSDTEKPVMTSATVDEESITATSVKINVAGTDNVGVAKYVVYNGVDKVGEYTVDANNQIEITGLTPNTDYTYTIKAKDAAKNESESGINVTFTTSRIMASVCKEEMTSETKTIEMSCVSLGGENYRIVVTSDEKMTGWGGAFVGVPGVAERQLNNPAQASVYLSADGKTMITDFSIAGNPGFNTPVYIMFENGGQSIFTKPTSIIWGACDDLPAPKTASDFVLTSEAELTLEIDETSQIAYTSSSTGAVTYEVNNSNVVVSASGLITAKTAGSAIVTVKQAEDAAYQAAQTTINITINSPSAVPMGTKEWYAFGNTKTDGQAFTDGYTFHVTATGYEDNATVVVECTMLDEARNPGAMYLHDMKNTSGSYEHAMDRSGKTGTYTFTSTDPLVKGQELQFAVKFAYDGGLSRTEVITYNVGAEQAMPAIEVTSVEITPASVATMAIGETLDLVAVAKPSIATDRDIIWSLESGADVISLNTANGHIEALTAGDAQVKAATANGVYALCNIHVEAEIEATVYNGVSTIALSDFVTVANWSVTRNIERKLVYTVVFDVNMAGKVMQVKNDADNFAAMEYDAATKTATFTSTSTYADGSKITPEHFIYFGGPRIELGSYTVGSSQAAPATKLVSINDIVENATPAEPVNVVLGRSFVADGGLYTLSLPFDMSAEQIAEAFGDCYIAQLTSVEERGADMLHLNFNYVDAIVAGIPYLFLPKQDITNPTIEGVTLNFTAKSSGDAKAMMYAVLQPQKSALAEGSYVLGADNYLTAVSATNNGMKGLRAYFTLATAPSGVAPRAKVVLGTNTTTGMENATINHGAQKVLIDGQLYILRAEGMFNVQGQLVK